MLGQHLGEFAIDRKLGIQTSGVREWLEDYPEYNRYESTPYRALDDLFERHQPPRTAHLVDYGCGLGRVLFYYNYHFRISGTGIEYNEDTYMDALRNLDHYREKRNKDDIPIQFVREPAERWPVPAKANLFFFFNPFSYRVFEEVVQNIIESLAAWPRQVDIILFYPLVSYRQVLQKWPEFELIDTIMLEWGKETLDRFMIYRYTPDREDLDQT